MPWLALPRGDQRLKEMVGKYKVKGVPRLVVIKPDGEIVDGDAIRKVTDEGPGAIEEYLAQA